MKTPSGYRSWSTNPSNDSVAPSGLTAPVGRQPAIVAEEPSPSATRQFEAILNTVGAKPARFLVNCIHGCLTNCQRFELLFRGVCGVFDEGIDETNNTNDGARLAY